VTNADSFLLPGLLMLTFACGKHFHTHQFISPQTCAESDNLAAAVTDK
jgi:hypothetical protein